MHVFLQIQIKRGDGSLSSLGLGPSGSRVHAAGPALATVALLLASLACSDGTETKPCPVWADAGPTQPSLVLDKTIQKLIEYYQITLVGSRTRSNQAVLCTDIPNRYRPGDSNLTIIRTQRVNRDKSGTEAMMVRGFSFPINQEMVVVAEGVALDSAKRPFTVARGCADRILFQTCNPIPVGKDGPLEIDLVATTGGPCTSKTWCEAWQSCLDESVDSNLKGGYCARTYCASDGTCPPGSSCISDAATVGICARQCSEIADCKTVAGQAAQDCAYRKGAAAGQCYKVCVPPLWKNSFTCTL